MDQANPATEVHKPERLAEHMRWATWRATCVMVLIVLAARVIYLIVLCPYDLVADEAHYWEWSRRLQWSYYSKGPGVAWLIALSTRLLGSSEWSVRLPAAITSAITALALARIAIDVSRGDQRVGFFAALMFCLTPGYIAVAQLMTIDGPYVACWVLAVWAAQHAINRRDDGRARLAAWAALGLAVGVGVLMKYTMLLLLPGLALWLVMQRKRRRWSRGDSIGLAVATLVAVVAMSPIFIWNAQNGWPTVSHLLGRLNLPGGDERVAWEWSPMWVLEFIGAQIGIAGPFGAILMAMGARRAYTLRHEDAQRWADQTLLLCAAAPLLIFYFVISLAKPTQGNWAIAAFATLLVPAAQLVVVELPRHAKLVAEWLASPAPRPKRGYLRRKPETLVQIAWHWFVGFGVGTALFMALGPHVLTLPGLKQAPWAQSLRGRIQGHREESAAVDTVVTQMRRDHPNERIIIIATGYGNASLLAFYMQDHPIVYSAQSDLGGRQSVYDYFADTNLAEPALTGATAVLVGSRAERWRDVFHFSRVEPAWEADHLYIGYDYHAPRRDSSRHGGS